MQVLTAPTFTVILEGETGMFPITDPELGRWLAESPDLSRYGG